MVYKSDIKVSIIILVYNHENYIEQCLSSLFSQKVNFNVEYIIGDDCSKDNTHNIIQSIIKEYPQLNIHYTKNATNQGLMKNFKQCFDACQGKYVALCAGDDYWISEDKLQKQYDYLESHPDFICTSTDTLYLEGNEYRPYSYVETKASWLGEKINDEFLFQQLANRFFPHPNTMFFKNQGILPEYFLDFLCEDYPLYLLLSSQGRVHFFNEKMTVYRIHEASIVQSSISKAGYNTGLLKIIFLMNSVLKLKYSSHLKTAFIKECKRFFSQKSSKNELKCFYSEIETLQKKYNHKFINKLFFYLHYFNVKIKFYFRNILNNLFKK